MRLTSVFSLVLAAMLLIRGAGAQTVSTVYSFSGSDGEFPKPALAQGRDGMLYGTTYLGGAYDEGTIFKLNPKNGQLMTLYTFTFTDGEFPAGGLTLATDGNFYGTSQLGGANGEGVLFRVSPTGVYTVLHAFTGGSDGNAPTTAPIETESGVLYGTSGGAGGNGEVSALYKFVISSGEFSAVYTIPSSFGNVPSPPVQINNGDFFISTDSSPSGCGSLLRITPAGVLKSSYTFSSCYSKQGAEPNSIVAAADGNVYGTSSEGGISWVGGGTVFRDNPATGIVSVVHGFGSVPNDGINGDGLMQATDGNFYGTTVEGGTPPDIGTIFKLSADAYTILASFPSGGSTPPLPFAPTQHTTGTLYGVTFAGGTTSLGSVYSLDMGLGPFVSLVCDRARVGQQIQILGENFTGATAVTVNGAPVTSFHVASNSFMTAVIPAGVTTGPVVVTAPSGILTSNRNLQIVQ
jgi:uncharacterized repeat protein (TIGR03803 family)